MVCGGAVWPCDGVNVLGEAVLFLCMQMLLSPSPEVVQCNAVSKQQIDC